MLLGSLLLLTGCSETSLPEFAAEQNDGDIIERIADQPDIDPESTRYVGEVEGIQLYLARGEDRATCLIQMRGDMWVTTGCGAGDGVGVALPSGTRIEVGTFTFDVAETDAYTRTELSDSVTLISRS